MKKVMIILLFVAVLLCSCSNNPQIEESEQVIIDNLNRGNRYFIMNTLSAYEFNNNYRIITSVQGNKKAVEFSAERKCLKNQGIDLINNYDISQFLGENFNEVKFTLGKPHVDIGSGFSYPSYITKDAYLITFYEDDNIVKTIKKWDLLTGEKVEHVSFY